MHFGRRAALSAAAVLLSSCAVGPDFERPPPPAIQAYELTPLPQKTASAATEGGATQQLVGGADVPAEWWTLFHSEALNRLVLRSLQNNPDLAAAEAALREAHENLRAGEGALFPSVDAGFNAQRQKISSIGFGGAGTIPPFSLYNATVNVSYGLDIFGGNRRQIEALGAAEDFQQYEMEAARLSLTANVVTAAITEASLRSQIDATKRIIEEEQKQYDVLESQLKLGAVAKQNVLLQAATVAQTRATLPPLEKQLAQTRHQISVLGGQFPSEEPEATFAFTSLKLPEKVPVSLPSKLVEQRPDVRAAESTLHAASAEIGVATANMLPQFTISGDIGSEVGKLASLFAPGGGVWALAAGVTQPIFHGGELLHKKRASEAEFDQAAAQYRKTVLAAFQDVADSLRALESDAAALKAQAEAEHAAHDSLQLSTQQYKEGAIAYIALLTAEQTEQQAKLALVQAEGRRFADTAALLAALGGGWWNRVDATNIETPATAPAKVNFNNGADDASAADKGE